MVFSAFTLFLTIQASQSCLFCCEFELHFLLLRHEGVDVPLDLLIEVKTDTLLIINLYSTAEALLLRLVSHLLKAFLLFVLLNR